ncbi:MAG TPA: heme biosynthesis HemY N-terminal domain-containing protein [Stellaceae bacterium]|nr:heme biosynthesis HemY N-terminal domain-containing protein [Stellaceae bacterium]
MHILFTLLLLAAAVAAGVYFADNPGQVEIAWQGWVIDTSVGVLAALAALLAFVAAALALLVAGLRRTPAALRRRRKESRRRAGEAALTQGLVALAAADAAEARRHAGRARMLLGETPIVLLLSAEASSRQGDPDAARRAYAALLERRDTEFLGLRGLIGQALRAGDDAAALPLAERARALRPDAPWLADNLLRLQARAGDWQAARDTLSAAARRQALPAGSERHGRGVVLYELSRSVERAGDLRRASTLAPQAQQLAPDLAPIACHNARLLLARGRRRAAARAIERAWQTAPHSELAKLYLEARGAAEPLAGAASLQRLAARNPEAIESHLAIGEAALAARLWGEARRHLTLAAEATPPAPSRRLCLLMARLEESEAGEPGVAREWLDRAIGAPPDPCYVCGRCGAAASEWRSVCPACSGFDTLTWRAPEVQNTIGVYPAIGTTPLMLSAVDAPYPPVVSAQPPEPLGSGRTIG